MRSRVLNFLLVFSILLAFSSSNFAQDEPTKKEKKKHVCTEKCKEMTKKEHMQAMTKSHPEDCDCKMCTEKASYKMKDHPKDCECKMCSAKKSHKMKDHPKDCDCKMCAEKAKDNSKSMKKHSEDCSCEKCKKSNVKKTSSKKSGNCCSPDPVKKI